MPSTGEKKRKVIETSIGRLIFNDAIPQNLGFVKRETDDDEFKLEIDQVADKKLLGKIIHNCYRVNGVTECSAMADRIKALGFKYSTIGAVTVAVSDVVVPKEKPQLLHEAEEEIKEIQGAFEDGLLSDEERYKRVIGVWDETTNKVTDALKASLDTFNPITMMANSGARGSINQIRQLAGMRGLMADPSGHIIELPIRANFREGLTVLEFFTSSHGARKGLADTALKTANSGYLTRRLVDVSQDVVVREEDCFASRGERVRGMEVTDIVSNGQVIETLEDRINGRVAAEPVYHPETHELLCDVNQAIDYKLAKKIVEAGVKKVTIRTVLTCRNETGVCAKCYGANMATGEPVDIGEAVGIVAAQSIGEPGTQLTMRTFHTGGVAQAADITQGLPRVEELFEARKPKGMAIITEIGGVCHLGQNKNKREVTVTSDDGESVTYPINYGARLTVTEGQRVAAGDPLIEGSVNPHDILKIKGVKGVQAYITLEVLSAYRMQGVDICDKHIEVIVRQMLRKVRIEENGDTDMLPGSLVDIFQFERENDEVVKNGGQPAVAKRVLLGITKASLATESFLSAASFQETTRVLTEAAIKGKVDPLIGLKENVLIGKLIPAGTGMKRYHNLEIRENITD